jgi:hypothetical protein
VIFQSWSEEKILRLEYVVRNSDFVVMGLDEETKTGVWVTNCNFSVMDRGEETKLEYAVI